MPVQPLTLLERVTLSLFRCFLFVTLQIRSFLEPNNRPTYVKSYSYRPSLRHRVFLPRSFNLKEKKTYPLIIEIHGGGFVVGHPCMDDEYCRLLSSSCSAIVVAINYRKAPWVQYPTQQHDCRDGIQAILSDPDLPIDHDNVVISGMSAGGNLALSTAQSDTFRGKFKAVVAWYPITDFTASLETRLDYRPKTDTPDGLIDMFHTSNSAYLPATVDMKDPCLSPFHANVEAFPKRAFVIGAEHDMLLYDSQRMAEKLAGNQEKVEDDEDESLLSCWTAGHVVWTLARKQPHGFNQVKVEGDAEIRRRDITDAVHKRLTRWLCEVFN